MGAIHRANVFTEPNRKRVMIIKPSDNLIYGAITHIIERKQQMGAELHGQK